MKTTITVFKSETHVEVFKDEGSIHYEIVHPPGLTYEDAVAEVPCSVSKTGGRITHKYFELNEFGDPITCFFMEA